MFGQSVLFCEKDKPVVTALLLAFISSWQKDSAYADFLE